MSAISEAIERCFIDPNEENLRALDKVLRPRIFAILASVYRKSTDFIPDAYQSAFIKYWNLFKAGKNNRINYEGYFVVIAKNCLVDELRKEHGSVPLDDLQQEITAEHWKIEEVEAGIMLFQAMSRLERRCQFLLEAHYINSMTDAEIAKRLSVGSSSIPAMISNCKQRLLGALKQK